MHDQVWLAFLIPLLLAALRYISSRGRHETDADGNDVFRYTAFSAYIASVGSFAAMIFFLYGYVQYHLIIALIWTVGFFSFSLFGIYMLTLRIRVGNEAICVSSVLGSRITPYNEIASVIDKKTGNYQTLYVKNKRGKRVLTITSSFVNDYDQLVSLLKDKCSITVS